MAISAIANLTIWKFRNVDIRDLKVSENQKAEISMLSSRNKKIRDLEITRIENQECQRIEFLQRREDAKFQATQMSCKFEVQK